MAVKKTAEAANTAENSEVVNSTTEQAKNESAGNNEAKQKEDTSVYTVSEFIKASGKVFAKPYGPDIIRAAFKIAGKTQATKKEAVEIVNKFLGHDKEASEK